MNNRFNWTTTTRLSAHLSKSLLSCAAICALGGLVAQASTNHSAFASKESLRQNVATIESVFDSLYAPKAWKFKFADWSLDDQITHLEEMIESEELTLRDYQKALRNFFDSTKDYHVGISFNSTEKATLPLEVRSAGDSYYIVWIDRASLSKEAFPYEPGDELVSFDGRPTSEVVAELKASLGGNTSETDQRLAEVLLTKRARARAMDVPQGPITLEVRAKGQDVVSARQLIWKYTPEQIHGGNSPILSTPLSKAWTMRELTMTTAYLDFFRLFANDKGLGKVSEETQDEEIQENPYLVGGKKSYVPTLGAQIWESANEDNFHAYTFRTDTGKIIGFIRIPIYVAGEKEAKEFAQVMKKFSSTTDALVIDQVNNPGGSVIYLYSLVSMLTDRPMATPKHRMSLTQDEISEDLKLLEELKEIKSEKDLKKKFGDTLGGYPLSLSLVDFIKDFLEFRVRQWNEGKVLTDPYFLYLDKINPHPEAQYTKPVLLLTNALDFSGGDFFPAILQDNQRVTILGTRTAGAGGYVNRVSFPNRLGIAAFNLTASIAERVDLNPIENLGVTPDIQYDLTAQDFQDGFLSYKTKILDTLESMLASEPNN